MVWHVLLLGKHTVTLVKASFAVTKLCGAGPASTTMGCTFPVCCTGFTVTVAVPDLLVSWVEVAVIVTWSDVTPPDGAVNKPEAEIVPALGGAHVTPELKFPVPVTVAEHWLVWPYWMVEGEQLTLTDVIVVGGTLLPPPQAAISVRLASTSNSPSFCTIVSPLADIAGLDALRQ